MLKNLYLKKIEATRKLTILFSIIFLSLFVYLVFNEFQAKNILTSEQPSNLLANEIIISEGEAIKIVSGLPEVKTFLDSSKKVGEKTAIRALKTDENGNNNWSVGVHTILELNHPSFNRYIVDGKNGKILNSIPSIYDENGKFVCITNTNNIGCYESD